MNVENRLQIKRKICLEILNSIQNNRKSYYCAFMSIFKEDIDFAKGLEKTFIVT